MAQYQPPQHAIFFTSDSVGDHKGRVWQSMLADGSVSDEWLERHHDYIQWWFPLMERSTCSFFAPVLSKDDLLWMHKHAEVAQSQIVLAERMKRFYADNDYWLCHYDHNHLRITRIIKSLRLIVGDEYADEWKSWLWSRMGNSVDVISLKAISFWKAA